MKEINKFVHQLFKQQHLVKEDHVAVTKLIEMLSEKVEDLVETGMNEDDAIHKTIIEFGELDDFYESLVKREKRRYKTYKTLKHYRNDLVFSVLSSLIIIALILYTYFALLPYKYWFIVPCLGILFWPLSLLYKLLNKKGD